jgi:flagellar biosynthetic protein FliR
MEALLHLLLPMLTALWWPFCRIVALLSAAPVVGEAMVPMAVRVLIAIVLAVVLLPVSHGGEGIDPMSVRGIVAAFEQAVVGGLLGLAFHLAMSAVMVLGYLVSSQLGFAMAAMNDPVNGVQSDVVSSLMTILCALVFFSIDGHLVLIGVAGASFQAWPVGAGFSAPLLQSVTGAVGWIFAAGLLLALPIVFSTLVVQIGMGFLNRVAPALNLFSLGFSVVTLLGVLMLGYMVRFLPGHYVATTTRVLELLQQQMQAVPHG